jgi:hypothetical protein
MDMKVHLLGVAYCPCDPERFPYCSYSTLLRSVAGCLLEFGVECEAYVAEGTPPIPGCTTHECVSLECIHESYNDFGTAGLIDRNGWSQAYESFCSNARRIIDSNCKAGDVVLVFHGGNHRPAIPQGRRLVVAEFPGHTGHWAPFCAFPSRAFWHFELGAGRRKYLHYDTVIPHPVPDPGEHQSTPESYLLFVGRMVPEKGHAVAEDVAAKCGLRLVSIGQGPNGRLAGRQERDRLMAGAVALLVPSLTCEPFGLVAAEANAVGCPAVCFGWGGPPEFVSGAVCSTVGDMVTAVRGFMEDPESRSRARRRYLETCSPAAVGGLMIRWLCRIRDLELGRSDFYSVPEFYTRPEAICINLERRPDRRQYMEDLGRFHRMKLRFVEAVDHKSIPECPWEDSHVLGNARAKYACALSHIRAWNAALESDSQQFLFLEDDVFLARCVWQRLSERPQGDLVMLNACRADETELLDGWNRAHHCVMAGAYLVSRFALQKLLDRFEDRPDVADVMLCHIQDSLVSWVHRPYLAMQKMGGSDVQTGSHQDRVNSWARERVREAPDFYF